MPRLFLIAFICTAAAACFAQAPEKVYLDSLTPVEQTVGWDRLRANQTIDGDDRAELGGKPLDRFLMACANSRLVYELPPGATRFQAVGTSTNKFRGNGSWYYEVWADAVLLFRSRPLHEYNPREVKIDVELPIGAKRIMLVIDNEGSGTADHSIWAEPCFVLGGSLTPPSAPRSLVAKLPAAELDGVVLVEGERSVGTGFFALIRDQAFVVTNQHILANNARIRISNRTGIRPAITGYVFARDRDLALLRIDADPATLPLLKIAESAASAAVGEELLIAGNSEGGGTVLQSEGRIVGFGFDRVEHDIATVSGNSGSPVFRQSTWEVLAIDTYSRTRRATRTTDPASRNAPGTSLADIRHFGVRIDSAKDWAAIDWDTWQKECAHLTAIERRIEGLEKLMTEERATWITYPDIAARVQTFEERSRGFTADSVGFRREAASFFQNLLTYAQAQQRAANQLKERNIGHVREEAESLASYAVQIETTLRRWDVNVADRLKSTSR